VCRCWSRVSERYLCAGGIYSCCVPELGGGIVSLRLASPHAATAFLLSWVLWGSGPFRRRRRIDSAVFGWVPGCGVMRRSPLGYRQIFQPVGRSWVFGWRAQITVRRGLRHREGEGGAMRSAWPVLPYHADRAVLAAGYATPSCGKFAPGLCGNGVASGLRRTWRVFGRRPRRCMMRPA